MARRVSFKKGTHAYSKRREVAEAIERENPNMSKSRKFAIATAAVKRSRRTRHSGE